LVDGIIGNQRQLGKTWLGFQGKDVVATIDFGQKTQFSEVYFNTLTIKEAGFTLRNRLRFLSLMTERILK
jgi:hypothetical protein